jgi:hypothetical protein
VIEERIPKSSYLTIVDGLKNTNRTNKGKSVGLLAREAMRWTQESFHSDDGSVLGQGKEETVDELAVADDAILACCMFIPIDIADLGT